MSDEKKDVEGRERRWRVNWSVVIRITIIVVAVGWIVYQTDLKDLADVWERAKSNKLLILLGILTFGPAPVIISVRLKWLLAVHDIHLTFWQAVKVTFAGNFVIWTLPVGTPGGDSVKAYYVARETPHKHEAVTTVFFDRVIGVLGLVLISGVVVLLNWNNEAFASWGRIIGVLILLLFVGGGIYFSHGMRKLFRLDWILTRLPFTHHLQRIDQAVLAFRQHAGRVLVCLLLSWVLQGMVVVSVFLCGWALGLIGDKPLGDLLVYLGYTPICLLAGVLPIGVMENLFKELLVDQGHLGDPATAQAAAYSLSVLNRLIQLLWALPGGLVVLRGGRRVEIPDVIDDA
jgi:uncharacterized protein (TIRG00374 family)